MLGALAIDHGRRRVTVGSETVELTVAEYDVLRTLALDAGQVVTCETLLRRAWSGCPNTKAHLVRIVVNSLRRKLGDDAADPAWIFNQRGVGYRMAEPPDWAEGHAAGLHPTVRERPAESIFGDACGAGKRA